MKSPQIIRFGLTLSLGLALITGCAKSKDPDDQPATSAANTEPADGNGVTLDAATQARIGIETALPVAAHWEPEMTAYGMVLDPAALAEAAAELTAASLSADASAKECTRQELLASQNNASVRAVETARTTARQDELARTTSLAKFKAQWGAVLAGRINEILPLLASNQAALVRLDLPAGDNPSTPPLSAQILASAGETNPVSAQYLDALPGVDLLSQGQSYLFLVRDRSLPPNAAVTGFLKIAGDAVNGVTLPAAAILRYEGRGWVYVQTGTNHFQREPVPLDYPVTDGWFVPGNWSMTNGVVVTGAQTVLSAELSGGAFNTGERD
jgi:hypothetical protein